MWPRKNTVHLVQLWLDRSKSQPLSLFLGEHPFGEGGSTPVRDILALFISHAHRWQAITLGLNDAVQDMFRDVPLGVMSSLDLFDISVRNWSAGSLEQLSLCLHSSSLRKIAWENFPQDYLPTSICWSQLTEITLGCVRNSEDLFEVLVECRVLRVLNIPHLGFTSPRRGDGYIILPDLYDLRLGFVADVARILDGLFLPRLTEFRLNNGFRGLISDGWNASVNLLQRSECRLKTFTYNQLGSDETELIQALAMPVFSYVSNITIGSPISDVTLNALNNRNLPLLPRLEEAFFTDCHTSDGAISSFVLSRLDTSQSLTLILRRLEANLCGPSLYSYDLQLKERILDQKIIIMIDASP
ncbi:hypothetical protein K443DRAFT_110148 [Laccaria amethystina LaAM-08-1]|uniref:F-box domain-containing protein n=1 Tax=Laccaria amethystina LaAM-08-1 TaxID=1095629 RepID=A0A0C9WSF2_9AGAR|nr:hypothetical protein K443DRAFT_110148 [Laccaria amethystina LaAM-08-1]